MDGDVRVIALAGQLLGEAALIDEGDLSGGEAADMKIRVVSEERLEVASVLVQLVAGAESAHEGEPQSQGQTAVSLRSVKSRLARWLRGRRLPIWYDRCYRPPVPSIPPITSTLGRRADYVVGYLLDHEIDLIKGSRCGIR